MLGSALRTAVFTFCPKPSALGVSPCTVWPFAPNIISMLGPALCTAIFTFVFRGLRAGREPLYGVPYAQSMIARLAANPHARHHSLP